MGTAIVTLKIMPESPETDLDKLRESATEVISEFGGNVGKHETEPVAFGLMALKIFYTVDESLGGTDEVEEKVSALEGVASVNVIDVRRALG